jgi:hypothetical protein
MRRLLISVVLLGLLAGICYGEFGVGVSAGYPLAYALIEEADFDSELLFAGAAFRWKPSAFLLDLGVSGMLGWPFRYGFLDFGVCGDLGILRLALAGGVDIVGYSEPGLGSYSAFGFNAKVYLDFKIGRLTVGASAAIPLDLLLSALTGDGIESDSDYLRIFAAQPTINVMYWFGESKRSRVR